VAAVGAELDVAIAQLNGLSNGSLGPRTFKDGFNRLVDGSPLAIDADDGHNLVAHVQPLDGECTQLTTEPLPCAVTHSSAVTRAIVLEIAIVVPDILGGVIMRVRKWGLPGAALVLALGIASCHSGEQAVVGVAQNAVKAEQKAQATATERDSQRAQLAAIPLPTKSLYVDVHERSAWTNPFISVGSDMISMRILMGDANTSNIGQGTMLRPTAARSQEVQLRLSDLANAVSAVPASAWPYGRVIAVAEAPSDPKDRPKVRRNLEAAIQQLNDLGIVVEEWPAR